jgi:excisionase family DNA binding protein
MPRHQSPIHLPVALSVTEAAKVVRCRRTVLEEFIRTGELKAFSVGGKRGTRISLRALEEFMEKRTLRTMRSQEDAQ